MVRAGRNGCALILPGFAAANHIRCTRKSVCRKVYSAHRYDAQVCASVTPLLSERGWYLSFLAWYFVAIWGSGFIATKLGLELALFQVVPSALSVIGFATTCAGIALVAWKR